MDTVEQNLALWRTSLVETIPLGGLVSRNPIVYKWKAPFRCWMLREVTFWRLTDLLTQSHSLHLQQHGLGARVLLRSGFETLAILIYLNQLIGQLLNGTVSFQLFSDKTSVLLLGSRDGSTQHSSLNIVTILSSCDRRYPGLQKLYGALSESAHPNYEGMAAGYSIVSRDDYETCFTNRWMDLNGEGHSKSMELCMQTFIHEYEDVWTDRMDELERWISIHNASLEEAERDELPD